ncbi:MAG: hypothetical protein ACRD1H_20260 [Vicinamibacterales bacterium]
MTDGIRLATVNAVGLVVGAFLFALASFVSRVVGLDGGLPVILVLFGAAIAVVCCALFVWYRYAEAHGRAARLGQRGVRPDVFGAIAGLPFVAVGLLLIASGVFSLFWALLTFSLSRAGDGLQRLLFAVIFLGLAAGCVIMARAAND